MFCDQCEQTAKGTGCTVRGVCGKDANVALIQDQLILQLRRLAMLVNEASTRALDITAYDDFIAEALFATLTNVNFDPDALRAMQLNAFIYSRNLSAQTGETPGDLQGGLEDYLAAINEASAGVKSFSSDADVDSAMQLILYGLKGLCAYKTHAARLGKRDAELSAFVRNALLAGTQWDERTRDLGGWLEMALKCGEANLKAMDLLDEANTGRYGNPEPSLYSTGHKKGKAILISGHDLLDLEELLKQIGDKDIKVYTHGEMLPAHGYPGLRSSINLAGNFGTAWENQQKEMPNFPGPILFTTNCIQEPKGYGGRVFTTGSAGWPGCRHLTDKNFAPVIEAAEKMEGFTDDAPGKELLTGFGRQTMAAAIPAILELVRTGKLKHVFVVGGCDGAKPSREYYTKFVEQTPEDTIVMTLGCGKFRFYDKDLGKIGDFPRLMDCGQCNDAYTAIKTAVALAEALKCGVNDLPLSLVISWYEQKAVAILLTLLALNVRNVIIGPSLPAFISPAILKILVEKWGLRLMTTPVEDMKTCLAPPK